jgi:hypothetical protein
VESTPLGAIGLRGFGKPLEVFSILRLREAPDPGNAVGVIAPGRRID